METIVIWKEILPVLERVGFPIVVACFLLFRTDKRLDKIIDLHQEMLQELIRHKKE
jgi:hypothetical protein